MASAYFVRTKRNPELPPNGWSNISTNMSNININYDEWRKWSRHYGNFSKPKIVLDYTRLTVSFCVYVDKLLIGFPIWRITRGTTKLRVDAPKMHKNEGHKMKAIEPKLILSMAICIGRNFPVFWVYDRQTFGRCDRRNRIIDGLRPLNELTSMLVWLMKRKNVMSKNGKLEPPLFFCLATDPNVTISINFNFEL